MAGHFRTLLARRSFSVGGFSLHCSLKLPAMKRLLEALCLLFISFYTTAQDPWKITASQIDPSNYYGVTVANGMIGIVSSPEPFKVKLYVPSSQSLVPNDTVAE